MTKTAWRVLLEKYDVKAKDKFLSFGHELREISPRMVFTVVEEF